MDLGSGKEECGESQGEKDRPPKPCSIMTFLPCRRMVVRNILGDSFPPLW